MSSRCARALMDGLIDYAGLFPPARLSMPAAVEEYNRCRMGEFEWVLGRFICPVSKLGEFSKHAAALMPGTNATSGYRELADAGEPWRVSALIDGKVDDKPEGPGPGGTAEAVAALDRDLNTIHEFNRHHAREENGLAGIDVIELKAPSPQFIDDALDITPEGIFPFFEFPVAGDCRGFVAALAGNQSGAKIRTGGITPTAIPSSGDVANFLVACAAADVPFKATAGLHHAVRSEYALDTVPGSPRGVMHGFFNLFFAAALVRARGLDAKAAAAVLEDRMGSSFRFTDGSCAWKDQTLDAAELARVRESFALSFGSCSFDEPVGEVRGLGVV